MARSIIRARPPGTGSVATGSAFPRVTKTSRAGKPLRPRMEPGHWFPSRPNNLPVVVKPERPDHLALKFK